jgi:hypothetical protein
MRKEKFIVHFEYTERLWGTDVIEAEDESDAEAKFRKQREHFSDLEIKSMHLVEGTTEGSEHDRILFNGTRGE